MRVENTLAFHNSNPNEPVSTNTFLEGLTSEARKPSVFVKLFLKGCPKPIMLSVTSQAHFVMDY